jgi:hypothetical protein
MMTRAIFLKIAVGAAVAFAEASPELRGKLIEREGGEPAIETQDGKMVPLAGDAPTLAILQDKRLANREFRIKGKVSGAGIFEIEPLQNRALLVCEGDKILRVTYYCDVCSIRTYSPGPCPCCQAESRLDLIDPLQDR